MITLVTRKPQQIVGFDVAYDKSEERIQKIVDSSINAKHYYSDANPSYQDVSYFGEHFYFRDKSHTFTVEGINLTSISILPPYNVDQNAFLFFKYF